MAVNESGENLEQYGCFLFDDDKKCVYLQGFFGWLRVNDDCFADICTKILLKKPLDGTYRVGKLIYAIETSEYDGLPTIKAIMDSTHILRVEF